MVKKKVAWRDKKAYVVIAPKIFNLQELGTTFTDDSKKLVGRTISQPLSKLSGDKAKQPTSVSFEITKVEGDKAKTKIKRIALDSRYIRSKVRKGVDKAECMSHLNFSSAKVWIKVIVITHQSTQTSKIKVISGEVAEILKGYEKLSLNDFLQAVLFGKLGTEIYRKVKKIAPIKRVEVEKVKVL